MRDDFAFEVDVGIGKGGDVFVLHIFLSERTGLGLF